MLHIEVVIVTFPREGTWQSSKCGGPVCLRPLRKPWSKPKSQSARPALRCLPDTGSKPQGYGPPTEEYYVPPDSMEGGSSEFRIPPLAESMKRGLAADLKQTKEERAAIRRRR